MAFRRYGGRARRYYGRARAGFRRYGTRKNAIASMPYIAGAAIGFTGIADKYIPANIQNVLMVAAVLPAGVTGKVRGLGQLKAVAQGYVLGRVVKGVTGFGGINASSGISGGPWL